VEEKEKKCLSKSVKRVLFNNLKGISKASKRRLKAFQDLWRAFINFLLRVFEGFLKANKLGFKTLSEASNFKRFLQCFLKVFKGL